MWFISNLFCCMFPDEDSISDWSSESYGWSEDEMEADLDVITSPLSCSSVASTTESQETVRCVCEADEENDFMLQVNIHLACMLRTDHKFGVSKMYIKYYKINTFTKQGYF